MLFLRLAPAVLVRLRNRRISTCALIDGVDRVLRQQSRQCKILSLSSGQHTEFLIYPLEDVLTARPALQIRLGS